MDDVHASVAESRTNLTQAMTGGDQQGAELAALTPGSFYVSTEKAVLQARAPGPADPEAGVRIDDVLEDDEPGLFPSDFEERVQNWIRRNEQGPVHPCHWLVFAVLGILFALSLGCWALTLHEYKRVTATLDELRIAQENATYADQLSAPAGGDGGGGTNSTDVVTGPFGLYPHHQREISLLWLSVSDSLLHFSFWTFAWAAIIAFVALLGSVACFVLPPNPLLLLASLPSCTLMSLGAMTWGLSFAIGIFVDTRLFLHLWVVFLLLVIPFCCSIRCCMILIGVG